MPSVYDLKPAFQNLLRPLCRGLARAGVTANQVTVLAALMSIGVGAAIAWRPGARWPLLLVPAALFLRMALNAIDGMLAREHGQASRPGAVLNELGDVISDAALYLPLALVPGVEPLLLVPAVVLAGLTEMTGVVATQIGASRRYDGPMGKSDRALVFGAFCLALGLGVTRGPWISWLLGVVLALLVMTVINRARRAVAEARAIGAPHR
ncbi:MAG TPA: CDP-alcohol phosphatidyltransferase family protein [Thermoanaerobaculia bacterium]|nr:CDP-alcohol phosphatidyltransferase family protein [Thermoanaerobaculia bacterium]